jgi:hypothetical protein
LFCQLENHHHHFLSKKKNHYLFLKVYSGGGPHCGKKNHHLVDGANPFVYSLKQSTHLQPNKRCHGFSKETKKKKSMAMMFHARHE